MGCLTSAAATSAQGSAAHGEVKQLIEANPVMVFSKSYCSFCNATKSLLNKNGVPFKAVELDTYPGGDSMHKCLEAMTGQSTVPNIYIGKRQIGGNDKLQAMARNGSLKQRLDELGVPNRF